MPIVGGILSIGTPPQLYILLSLSNNVFTIQTVVGIRARDTNMFGTDTQTHFTG